MSQAGRRLRRPDGVQSQKRTRPHLVGAQVLNALGGDVPRVHDDGIPQAPQGHVHCRGEAPLSRRHQVHQAPTHAGVQPLHVSQGSGSGLLFVRRATHIPCLVQCRLHLPQLAGQGFLARHVTLQFSLQLPHVLRGLRDACGLGRLRGAVLFDFLPGTRDVLLSSSDAVLEGADTA